MKNTSAALPHGWSEATLDDLLIRIVGGGTPPRNIGAYFDGTIPWFTVKDMKFLRPEDAKEHISDEAMLHSAANLIEPDTLIIATRIALGKAIMPTVRCAINQDLKALYFGSDVSPQFMLYWVMANDQIIQSRGSGTTVMGIRLEHVKEFPLAVPPAKEQTRIVEKLEELLSDLDAGVAELKTAQRKLAQYRQSLLKAAVEGALTADWRAARHNYGHPPQSSSPRKRGSIGFAHQGVMDSRFRGNDDQELSASAHETGAGLLQRVLTERRARWETKQLAKFAEQGKTPPKGWQAKYPEPATPNTTDLPVLPDGWVWATLDQLLVQLRSGTAETSGRDVTPHPVLKSSAVRQGSIDLSAVNFLNQAQCRTENYLEPGDLLITRLSGSVEYVGCAAIVGNLAPASLQYPDRIFCGKLAYPSPQLATHIVNRMRSPQARLRIEAAAKSTAGHKRISLGDLLPFPIPLPSLPEVVLLDGLVRGRLHQAEAAEAAAEFSLKQSAAQRKNILKAAFAGQLVPQDPNDEPASVLLERIRAERAQLSAARGVRRTGSNRAPATSSPNQSKRGRKPRTTA